jgi:hypothetical protein
MAHYPEGYESDPKFGINNFFVHKFVFNGVTEFQVNHVIQMMGEVERQPPNNIGFSNIAQAEAALGNMTANDNSNWFIQRVNGTLFSRFYKIHHSSAVNDKCPAGTTGYSSLNQLAIVKKALSKIHNENVNPIACA